MKQKVLRYKNFPISVTRKGKITMSQQFDNTKKASYGSCLQGKNDYETTIRQ